MTYQLTDIPTLKGKRIVITGANSGIGWEAARMLAGKGAHVVMACRNTEKGDAAAQRILAEHRSASLQVMELNVADLSSVRTFAERYGENRLDVLVNNAGVLALPFQQTVDGFEMQFGTNHLGHFALTGLLMDRLSGTGGPARVVSVSSLMHKKGVMRWGELNSEDGYRKWPAYSMSKLANLLFTYELGRRLKQADREVIALTCHPGYAATNINAAGAGTNPVKHWMSRVGNALVAQPAEAGALATVVAAAAVDMKGGEFIGPNGPGGFRGRPVKSASSPESHHREAQRRLWEVSIEMTGVDPLS
ncbi:MAG: NAD(P)-dependent dehydrogenase (short-subunit alcohol dehydrogenase family) [Bradymonadia bacterium]|jgi:NAD(P)-dependent dehydrogenase (short-subunit alcohol dehydrogenase family)